MTGVQVGQALLIAIVTAFATSVLYHWFEVRRLDALWTHEEDERAAQWKRETSERMAHYDRQRLDDTLEVLRKHVQESVQVVSDVFLAPTGGLWTEEAVETAKKVARDMPSVLATALSTGDDQLFTRVRDFRNAMAPALEEEVYITATDDEWVLLVENVTNSAALVLQRCDELVRDAYRQGIADEQGPADHRVGSRGDNAPRAAP